MDSIKDKSLMLHTNLGKEQRVLHIYDSFAKVIKRRETDKG